MILSGVVIIYAYFFRTPSRPVYRQSSKLILWRYLVLVSAETPAILTDMFYDFSHPIQDKCRDICLNKTKI